MQFYPLLLSCIHIVLDPMRDCHRYCLFFCALPRGCAICVYRTYCTVCTRASLLLYRLNDENVIGGNNNRKLHRRVALYCGAADSHLVELLTNISLTLLYKQSYDKFQSVTAVIQFLR
jgi:hypothetical protein